MFLLIPFAFLAGVVTILSPCILPILPIILSGAVGENKRKPLGIVIGFVASFTFFTLFLTSLVKASGISADVIRQFSIVVIFLFGLTLILPQAQAWIEKMFSAVSSKFQMNQNNKTGLFGGIIIGLSLGLLWTPCVGPILATVISLALTEAVTASAFFITLAYALGTAIPMFAIMRGGQSLLQKNRWLLTQGKRIQQGFGVIMLATAVVLYFNVDRKFQTFILQTFPDYGTGLTKFEEIDVLQPALNQLRGENEPMDANDKEVQKFFDRGSSLPNKGKAPELIPGGEWFNSQPFTLADQRGKVVLVDFWTFSCINCIRTLPYLKTWYEKYADQGLVIVGVHAPEFEFEKSPQNLQEAINDFEIKYPVVQDNNFDTWRAYDNHFWPAKYLIDKDGNIRYIHFGEGDYDETEEAIQTLLEESGQEVTQEIQNPEYAISARTPELYLGLSRMEYLYLADQKVQPNELTTYDGLTASELPLHLFSFIGPWTVGEEMSLADPNARLLLHFQAKDVFLVMNPKDENTPATVEVLLDGKVVDETNAGEDVIEGKVTIESDRLYRLIKLPEAGDHLIELRFPDGNVEVFAFTFG